jgi:hypothetical protein
VRKDGSDEADIWLRLFRIGSERRERRPRPTSIEYTKIFLTGLAASCQRVAPAEFHRFEVDRNSSGAGLNARALRLSSADTIALA